MLEPSVLLTGVRRDLARLPPILSALLDGLEPALWRERPAATEWSPVEIVCHLRDEEAEDFGARVRVVVEGRERFTPIDPVRWAAERRYRDADAATALAAFAERRAANLEFLATAPLDRLRVTVTQPGTGTLSGLDLLAAWVTHDRLHLAQLAATLARLGAHHWAPLRAEYAGPIPYAQGPPQ
jgi:DinB family protein